METLTRQSTDERQKPIERDAEWYSSVLNAMTDMVLVKGDRSKLLWANRAFLEYYGMTNEELADLVDAPHSDPDDTVQYVKDDHHVFSTGKTLNVVSEPVTDSAGRVGYFNTLKSAILGADGRVQRTVGVSRRIEDASVASRSEETRSHQKSSLQALRALVRHVPLALAMLDVKQRFLSRSDTWLSLFGGAGEPDSDDFYESRPNGLPALEHALEEVARERRPCTLEAVGLQGADGESLVVDIEIHPWLLPTEEVGGTIVLMHDITERVRSERALTRLNDELTQFNYRVSHDLVAPLRTIRGYLNIARDELSDDPELVRGLLGKMTERVDRLTSLVQDVLQLARSDVLEEERQPIELSDLVTEIMEARLEELEASGLEVQLELGAPVVMASRIRVQQVLENLVSNSIKYHDPERVNGEIRIFSRASAASVVLEVSDDGVGFDEELAEAVFDMFTRGSSDHPGSGLGLYLVQKHVHAMGGHVQVSSHRSPTTFRVELPRRNRP
ncbi:MAG: ATP-binding protein [Acidobacteriota bacterium]